MKKGWWTTGDDSFATLQTIVLAICWEESPGTESGHPQLAPPRIPLHTPTDTPTQYTTFEVRLGFKSDTSNQRADDDKSV